MITSLYNGYKVNLVETIKEIGVLKSRFDPKVLCGVDTETSGLSFISDSVAGYCISGGKSYSKDDYQGYYLPIRHYSYKNNLPIPEVLDFVQWVLDNFKSCFFNRPYDATMMEKDGVIFPCSPNSIFASRGLVGGTHDVQQMVHLIQGESMPALKDSVEKLMKMKVIEFGDNNAENNDFKTTDPTVSYVYAAQDPLITVLLGRFVMANFPYIKKIYPLDNRVNEAVRYFCLTTDLFLDQEMVKKEELSTVAKIQEVKQKIFSITGYEFKLNSTRDKGDAISRFVTLTQKTAKGQYAVNEEALTKVLDTIPEDTQGSHLIKLILEYAGLEKYRGSYVAKMSKFPTDGFHVGYNTCNVSTGRFSSGSSKGNDFFENLNIQNIPKEEVFKYVHFDKDLGYKVDQSECEYCSIQAEGSEFVGERTFVKVPVNGSEILVNPNTPIKVDSTAAWCFPESLSTDIVKAPAYVPTGDIEIEGCTIKTRALCKMKVKGGLRDAFICPTDYVWLSCDYSSQEMALMASFSREPNLIIPLKEGKDIHNHVAKQMFGFEDPGHRTKVKVLNFAVNYGAAAPTISRKLGISIQEAQALLDRYNQTLSKLYAWKEMMKKEARKKGMVFTYFGRPRVLYQYYNSSDKEKWAFADRSAINSPVQGTGGDLIRIDHVKLWERFHTDKEFYENCKYAMTVHDEINLFVKLSYVKKAFNVLTGIMNFAPENFAVPITVSPSVGTSWGTLVDAESVTENNHILIDRSKCKPFDGCSNEELMQQLDEWEKLEWY